MYLLYCFFVRGFVFKELIVIKRNRLVSEEKLEIKFLNFLN